MLIFAYLLKGYEPVLPIVHGAVGDMPREHLPQAARARARHRRTRRRQQRVTIATPSSHISLMLGLH